MSNDTRTSPSRHLTFSTRLGRVLVVAQGDGIVRIAFQDSSAPERTQGKPAPRDALLLQAKRQIQEYLAGKRQRFELPLALHGTPFQRRVWQIMQRIPYGGLLGYGEIARRIGSPGAARAVGAASGANPLPIVVPCHRVVGAGGNLVGYTGGLRFKAALLDLEGAA